MWLKRIFDILVSTAMILVALPLLVIISVLIKLDSSGPVIYRGKRMGKGAVVFDILKFRSMISDANKVGPDVTYKYDTRITRVGRLLRKTKLDELPQLFNVLRGEMSLVGPRAEDPKYRPSFEGRYLPVLSLSPGMTGLTWVRMHRFHEENIDPGDDLEKHYIEVSLLRKLEVDLEYVQTRSFWLDIELMLQTVVELVRRQPELVEDDN